MSEETAIPEGGAPRPDKDVPGDFLLCNRCGTCRSVCPLLSLHREEWAGARGKIELAEAFFRGEKIDDRELQRVFDLCLHCMTCEESCPSGVRASEIVMAVRAEMARRGVMPRAKRAITRALGGADKALFRLMRALRLVRRAPLHGVGGRGPLSFLYPLVGWPRERFIPLPAGRPFLGSGPELSRAADVNVALPDWAHRRRISPHPGEGFDETKAVRLADLVIAARQRNLASGTRAYFFVGHMVDNFFPEEARAVTRLLNILGVDVIAPKDQVCCGAPMYYAGDLPRARAAAAKLLERFEGHGYDWIVTSCSSGGLMLKEEIPKLFDLTCDGYFEIGWDAEQESFRRTPNRSTVKREYPRVEDLYRNRIEGRVRDVNELVAELLGLREEENGFRAAFGASGQDDVSRMPVSGAAAPASGAARQSLVLPIVTYHEPCHLGRGQGVGWQSEAILSLLAGFRYVRMKDHDCCCGVGGTFAFLHGNSVAEIAKIKLAAIAEVRPAVLATACPLCRIQLMDMIQRAFAEAGHVREQQPKIIPVSTPAELLVEDLHRIMTE